MSFRLTAVILTVIVCPCLCEEPHYDDNNHAEDDVTLMQLYMNDARSFNTKMPAKIKKGLRPEMIAEAKVEPRAQTQDLTPLELTNTLQRLRAETIISSAQTSNGEAAMICCVLAPTIVLIIVIFMSPSRTSSKEGMENKFELHWYHYALFVAIGMLGPMATDIILPAFPEISADLHASHYMTSLTMPVNMGVRGVSMVVIGTLSDRFGQKKMMVVSLVLFVCGCIICMTASNIYAMLIGRAVQALGEGSDALVQAVLRVLIDDEKERMKAISVVTSLQPVFIIIAPLLGSTLSEFLGWRSIYVFLMILSLISLLGYTLIVPETRGDNSPKQPLSKQFAAVLCNQEPVVLLVPFALMFTVLSSMLCNLPFILDGFKVPTIYKGLLIASMGPFVTLGAFVTDKIFQSEDQSLFVTCMRAMGFQCLLLVSMFSMSTVFFQEQWLVMASAWSIPLGMGMCLPALATLYLEPLKESSGLASGILIGAQNLVSALLMPIPSGALETYGIQSMFLVMVSLHLLGQTVFWVGFLINRGKWLTKDVKEVNRFKSDPERSVSSASVICRTTSALL